MQEGKGGNIDVEKAKAIKMSSDWEAICLELDAWIRGQLERTKTCSAEGLSRIQARISAYEEVKNLPGIVIDRED